MSMVTLPPCSVDIIEESLRGVGVVSHEKLDTLSVEVVGAGDEVTLLDVRHAVRQALLV